MSDIAPRTHLDADICRRESRTERGDPQADRTGWRGPACRRARAAGLLHISFDGVRNRIVNDKTNILLINAQTERLGCDHHIDLVGHERLLVGFAHRCLHPAMILASAKSFLDQPLA